MLNFQDFFITRNFLNSLSPYAALLFFFAAAFLFYAFLTAKKKLALPAVLTFTLAAGLCLSLLVYFHLIIYRTVAVSLPFPPYEVRAALPVWIENGKLLFWFFSGSVFTLLFWKNIRQHTLALRSLLLLFAICSLLLSFFNPLAQPLPVFTSEVTALQQAARFGDMNTVMAVLSKFRYYYGSSFMWIHPPLLFLGYACFLIAFPLHLLVLFANKREAIALEQLAYSFLKPGYLFLTAGMLTGYPWALIAWQGEAWWWSGKINVSIMMWLFYTAYLHGRLYLGRPVLRRLVPLTAIIAFLALVFTYLSTYLIPGVHSYA